MQVPRPLAGRYVFTKRIRGTQRTIIWLARDQSSNRVVVASVVPDARAAGLAPAVDLSHLHAATILKVIRKPDPAEIPGGEGLDDGSRVVVAEHVDGRSLQQRLDAGPVAVETAVEWIACAADALHHIHQKGAVHGAVSPRALVVVRPEPAIVPVLTHLEVPPSGAYCSPERVTGGGPSEQDDTWALAATLYTALSRRVPFQGASRTELARSIVAASPRPIHSLDGDLWGIVSRGLAGDRSARLSTAAGLRDALRDWMDREGVRSLGDFAPAPAVVGPAEAPPNVGDLSLVAALERPESPEAVAPILPDPTFSDAPPADDPDDLPANLPRLPSPPPPLESPRDASTELGRTPNTALAVGLPARPVPAPEKKRGAGTWAAVLVGAAVVSAAAGLAIGKLRNSGQKSEAPAPASPSPKATTEATPTPSAAEDLVFEPAPAASGAEGNAPAAETVASAAPPALSAAPAAPPADVTACVRSVLPEGTLRADRDVDVSYLCKQGDLWGIGRKFNLAIAGHGQGPGMVLWAHLGRFDLAAISLLFQRCCPEGAPLVTAVPKNVCEDLPASIDDLRRNPTPANVDRYAAGVDCFVSHGVRYPNDWWDRVGAKDARGYFEQLLGVLRRP
ncbi:MAG TPA: hypothetical protein VHE30_04785 [Polyangiaceae bacterium]|nr:hypothetical protein [Polyangiaceae bacterium]